MENNSLYIKVLERVFVNKREIREQLIRNSRLSNVNIATNTITISTSASYITTLLKPEIKKIAALFSRGAKISVHVVNINKESFKVLEYNGIGEKNEAPEEPVEVKKESITEEKTYEVKMFDSAKLDQYGDFDEIQLTMFNKKTGLFKRIPFFKKDLDYKNQLNWAIIMSPLILPAIPFLSKGLYRMFRSRKVIKTIEGLTILKYEVADGITEEAIKLLFIKH